MLGQIELGRSAPTINLLWKVARALDVTFSALIARARRRRAPHPDPGDRQAADQPRRHVQLAGAVPLRRASTKRVLRAAAQAGRRGGGAPAPARDDGESGRHRRRAGDRRRAESFTGCAPVTRSCSRPTCPTATRTSAPSRRSSIW